MKTSPVAAALEQLELERANLAARLAKVDAALANMRELFHLPRAPKMPTRWPTVRRRRRPDAALLRRIERSEPPQAIDDVVDDEDDETEFTVPMWAGVRG